MITDLYEHADHHADRFSVSGLHGLICVRPTYATATWLFLRLIGVAYLFAFWSLGQQILGLIGHDGILPAAEYMADVKDWVDATGVGFDRYRLVPTLCWLATSDAFLQGLAACGVVLAAMLIAGIASVAVLPLLWILYLSLTVVSGDFLSFQWDGLLLETGFLAVLVAPTGWRHRYRGSFDPPPIARWLIWLLLFRLMFGSGLVKLASGDPSWRDLTAMAVHYETQPLPTPLAWYVAQLPLWFHRTSTALVIAIELIVPCAIVVGGRWRWLAAVILITLQALIALTGNYAFFNLLTIALCTMLLDDSSLRRVAAAPPAISVTAPLRRNWLRTAAAVVIGPLSIALLVSQAGFEVPMLRSLLEAVRPLRSVNSYGLFAVMTTARPEIVVEGSPDGIAWRAYEFRYKPGDVRSRPPWIAPFQPRLDWQMWFAALSRYEEERWFQRFCARLLEGSPSVAALMGNDPFPGKPPRYVRAALYRYRFSGTSPDATRGAWWVRERMGEYSPVLSLDRGQAR